MLPADTSQPGRNALARKTAAQRDREAEERQARGNRSLAEGVKERDGLLAAERVRFQSDIAVLQDRCSRLLEWALGVRAAANKPMPCFILGERTAVR
jgi:hypothetical protein